MPVTWIAMSVCSFFYYHHTIHIFHLWMFSFKTEIKDFFAFEFVSSGNKNYKLFSLSKRLDSPWLKSCERQCLYHLKNKKNSRTLHEVYSICDFVFSIHFETLQTFLLKVFLSKKQRFYAFQFKYVTMYNNLTSHFVLTIWVSTNRYNFFLLPKIVLVRCKSIQSNILLFIALILILLQSIDIPFPHKFAKYNMKHLESIWPVIFKIILFIDLPLDVNTYDEIEMISSWQFVEYQAVQFMKEILIVLCLS